MGFASALTSAVSVPELGVSAAPSLRAAVVLRGRGDWWLIGVAGSFYSWRRRLYCTPPLGLELPGEWWVATDLQ